MARWVYRLTDGQWLRGGPDLPEGYDPKTEGVVELDEPPDYRLTRGDTTGVRAATPEELAAAARAAQQAELGRLWAEAERVLGRPIPEATRAELVRRVEGGT